MVSNWTVFCVIVSNGLGDYPIAGLLPVMGDNERLGDCIGYGGVYIGLS